MYKSRVGLTISLLSSSTLATTRGLRPALFLDFLSGSLDSRVGFSRGTNATMVDSTGRIVYAPANLLLRSQEFDNAYWAKLGSTVTANTTAAPDGTQTADKLAEDATTAPHYVTRAAADFTAGSTYTLSVYAKASERQWVAVGFNNEANRLAWFNLSTGVVGTVQPSIMATSIQSVGDGWYRCSVTSAVSTTNPYPSAMVANANGVSSYAGTAGSGIFVWGAQLEPVTYQTAPGPYVATTASAYYGPRFDYNPFTLGALGLLIEEQRTNLVTYSEQFDNAAWTKNADTVTANATVAPDGTSTADKLIPNTTNTQHFATSADLTPGACARSIYMKAGEYTFGGITAYYSTPAAYAAAIFNLANGTVTATSSGDTATITPAGNGWYRCTLVTAKAGATNFGGFQVRTYASDPGTNFSLSFAGDGTSGIFIWGAQLELGAFATSYIPTVASQVTRNADVATMTGTNFSGWYNQTAGTFVAEISLNNAPAVATFSLYSVSDNTANERIFVGTGFGSGGNINALVTDGGVLQAQTINGGLASAGLYKYGNAYAANDFASVANGGSVVTDASGTLPTVDRLYIGASAVGTAPINGHIRQIAYFNTRLPNAQLETLSSPSLVPTLVLDFTASSYASGY